MIGCSPCRRQAKRRSSRSKTLVKNKSIQRHGPAATPIRTCLYSLARTHQRSLIKAFKPAVSCQRPAATLERRAAQLVTKGPASDRRPRAHHRQAMCSQQPNGGRCGRLAVGELPLRKNNGRCQKQKSSRQNPCPKAIAPHGLRQCQLSLRNRGRNGKSGGCG